jgi:CarD family transcriptional regulator
MPPRIARNGDQDTQGRKVATETPWGGATRMPAVISHRKVDLMAAKALSFDVGDYVVYPKHGVGRVIELQSTDIAGMQLELYVLRFEKEKMTLRVPTNKAESVGMRKLSSDKTLRDALETLKGKPKVKRTMWSRRAQEYEAKINSGDLISIAEVTRDLFRADDQPEQSYSERQIFEAASSRLARELAAMEQIDEPAALVKILEILNKAAVIYNKEKAAV